MRLTYDDDMIVIYGDSTETKPTPTLDGEPYKGKVVAFYEMDTQKLFMFNYRTSQWLLQ